MRYRIFTCIAPQWRSPQARTLVQTSTNARHIDLPVAGRNRRAVVVPNCTAWATRNPAYVLGEGRRQGQRTAAQRSTSSGHWPFAWRCDCRYRLSSLQHPRHWLLRAGSRPNHELQFQTVSCVANAVNPGWWILWISSPTTILLPKLTCSMGSFRRSRVMQHGSMIVTNWWPQWLRLREAVTNRITSLNGWQDLPPK